MEELITVVIPTYHRPDRIARAVDSALKQTCRVQVIVVDDNGRGSSFQQETQAALSSYIQNQTIHYLINEKNHGGSYSRNRGLERAAGSFVTFLDDDDEIDPSKLEKQAADLIRRGEKYVCGYCGYRKIGEDGSIAHNGERIEGNIYPWVLARAVYVGSGSNLLVRTSAARQIGGYDESFRRNQDLEFFTRLAEIGKVAFLNEELFTIHYEIREVKKTYEMFIAMDDFYLSKFHDAIEALPEKERKAVYTTVALERWRHSIASHQQKDGFRNLKANGVSFFTWLRFVLYLMNRAFRYLSYGFKVIRPRKDQIHG
jgi:glycosyltransferase involved in cell wall biosynthesis